MKPTFISISRVHDARIGRRTENCKKENMDLHIAYIDGFP